MMPVRFTKARAAHVIECIRSGAAIAPAGEGWDQYDMMTVAGACLFACMTHGPVGCDPAADMADEHREAVEDSFMVDLRAALEFYAMMVGRVVDDEFDEQFEPVVEAVLSCADGASAKCRPVSGFKRP